MTANTELTIPNTTHPFFITVDASLVGLGAVLFQMNEENKMKVISYNSRILNTQEQKLSTLDIEVNHKTRSFNIDFALANIKYNILGTPFFKKHIQNIDFQQNIMTYIEQHPKLPTKTTFSTFTKKDYPYISHIYTIKCKEPIHFKPRSGKTIHFPIKN